MGTNKAATAAPRPIRPTAGDWSDAMAELRASLWAAQAILAKAAELDSAEVTECTPEARQASWLRYAADPLLKEVEVGITALLDRDRAAVTT